MTGCRFADTRWGCTLPLSVSQDISQSAWADSPPPLAGATLGAEACVHGLPCLLPSSPTKCL